MKLFKTKQIKELDAYTIEHEPIGSFELMQRASLSLSDELLKMLDPNRNVVVFSGPGNNGGDAFLVAFYLSLASFNVTVYAVGGKMTEDQRQARKTYESRGVLAIDILEDLSNVKIKKSDYVIDGLFGSGLNRPLKGIYGDVVKLINKIGAEVYAIDIPSGLFGEDNRDNDLTSVVKATHTLTLQFPKLSFFFAENEELVGEVRVLDISLHSDGIESTPSPFFMTEEENIERLRKKRKLFSHKGTYGHALLVAGSYGMMGAAILSSKACMRSGCGLLTTHIPRKCCDAMQVSVPEVIVSLDKSETCFSELPELKYQAIGIGPGLAQNNETVVAVSSLLDEANAPLVIDADALNIIAKNGWLSRIPRGSIITPHPKEFDRLAGESRCGYERFERQLSLAHKVGIIVVLKGAYTSIALPDGRCYFNSTGNPGMATAGSGDVLTGVILSLLAQGYTPTQAAVMGVFLHGKAGDDALAARSQSSLIASDIIDCLR